MCKNVNDDPDVASAKCLGAAALAFQILTMVGVGVFPAGLLMFIGGLLGTIGTSLLLCYSPCIDWGIDMAKMMEIQKMAVDCGYWPLYRYNPASIAAGDNAFSLDSKRIKSSLATYLQNENRYASLRRTNVERADYLQGEFEASTVKRMERNQRHATPHSPYHTPHIPHIRR